MSVTVIIPTYKPGDKFLRLMEGLKKQTLPPDKILIMNTEKKFWKDSVLRGMEQAEVIHISKEEFDHGRTRAQAAEMADSEFLIYTEMPFPLLHIFPIGRRIVKCGCPHIPHCGSM